MTGTDFREAHGDPAGWDDDEYEAYFAWTADQPQNQTPAPGDYQPAA
ncbi:hypothetical protein SUDANB145_07230 (plasmid) [Streptomyces sp. enrichment culture]